MSSYTEIERTDKLLFVCPFCGVAFKALARHTVQKHGISGRELRQRFGLKSTYQLITPELKERLRRDALRYDMPGQLLRVGVGTRFRKGCVGHVRSAWSPQALSERSKRIKNNDGF